MSIQKLIRDSSMAVLNKDETALEEYRAQKRKNRESKDMKAQLNNLEKRVELLEKLLLNAHS